jgi:hypothetical protein
MHHVLASGERCSGAGEPCTEPGCLNRGLLGGWRSLIRANAEADALNEELADLSNRVLQTFGVDAYEAAIIRANAIGKQHPNDPRAMNLALCDEFKRLLGPD